ncbi:hypothetical protein [Halogranum rubrum]|uniref:Uncharacterized protein n=1 Tax=Halogranum salarium B-1 TaxID=1210908 RepID=J3JFD3_9EURY|nr:hypothetical protein [Halogranum salarium]EJN59126.1 hypothetical protein HSB1_25470 [Halogranum salarium B-1]
MTRRVLVLAVGVLVLLAGCTGGSGPVDSQATTEMTDAAETTATATGTPTATSTPEPTPTAEWSSPTPPNSPTQVDEEQVQMGRISNVEFVNTVEGANGEGYSNFDLSVQANTTMEDVDPEHGTVDGEPYFVVLIDGKLVERTKLVLEQEDGQYNITVRGGALTNFDAGTLEVTVLLMDEDTQNDDVFGRWTGEIEYNPR